MVELCGGVVWWSCVMELCDGVVWWSCVMELCGGVVGCELEFCR